VNERIPTSSSCASRLIGLGDSDLILASRSPRRVELLRSLRIEFEQRSVSVVETLRSGEDPVASAVRLAVEKARAAVRPGEDALILGADTLVLLDGDALGKPRDPDEARGMIRRLSGRDHQVVTGVALVRTRDGTVFSDAAVTRVRFRQLVETEVDLLVDSGEAMDKAGGYGIQGLASLVVESVEGEYFNVVGLPLVLVKTLIEKAKETGA
jgi:septum formation protein